MKARTSARTTARRTPAAKRIPPAPAHFRALCQAFCLVKQLDIDGAWAAAGRAIAIDEPNTEARWDEAQSFINQEAEARLRAYKSTLFRKGSDISNEWGDLTVSITDPAMLVGMGVMFKLLAEKGGA